MAAPKTQPILELETLDSYVVRIDGTAYKLRAPDALPASKFKRVMTLSDRYNTLWASDLQDPQEEQEFERVLHELCEIVLDAPPALHAKLTDLQRLAIFQVFHQLPTTMLRVVERQHQATGAAPRAALRPRSTGASSRRASAGSTAATRGAGSRKSRSASSGRVTG